MGVGVSVSANAFSSSNGQLGFFTAASGGGGFALEGSFDVEFGSGSVTATPFAETSLGASVRHFGAEWTSTVSDGFFSTGGGGTITALPAPIGGSVYGGVGVILALTQCGGE